MASSPKLLQQPRRLAWAARRVMVMMFSRPRRLGSSQQRVFRPLARRLLEDLTKQVNNLDSTLGCSPACSRSRRGD
eukprot:1567513-Pyramimonas_sp.AAC.1